MRTIIIGAVAVLLVLIWPLFRLLCSHHIEIKSLIGQMGFAVVLAAFGACRRPSRKA
jgi:hypothetical protein